MKRTILLAGLTVCLGCGGDTSSVKKAPDTPAVPTTQTRTPPKERDDKPKLPPADVPEPPPPSAVKKKEGGDKKDADEPKAPPPIDKPGANPTPPAPKKD